MQTLTAEQFKKQYGDSAVASFSQPTQSATPPTYAQQILQGIATSNPLDAISATTAGVKKFGTGYQQTQEGVKNNDWSLIGRGLLNEASGGLETAFSPVTNVLSTGAKLPGISNIVQATKDFVINPLANKISDYKPLQDFMMKYPNADEVAGNLITIGLLLAGGKKAPEIKGAIDTGIQGISDTAGTIKQGVVDTAGAIKNKIPDISLPKVTKFFEQPIPEQVKTSLSETSSKTFDTYRTIAEKSAKSFKEQTPLEYAGNRAQEALDTINRKLNNIGETKSSILDQAKVGNKPVGSIVTKFRQGLNNFLSNKNSIEGDTSLFKDVSSEAQKLGSNPTAKQVDKFIDFVQERIYSGKRNLTIPVTDQATGALRQLTGQLNENLKLQLPESYRTLNSKYSNLVDVLNELNTKLGTEGEKGGALMRRVFSPSDAGTKTLFDKVRQETGIDLVNEATLARFVMESTGDVRQASMLQQLQLPNMSAKGMLQLGKEIIAKKLNTPDAILNRARELTTDSQLREANLPKPK